MRRSERIRRIHSSRRSRRLQPAVVAREDDDRLVGELPIFQRLQDPSDAPVHTLDHRGVDRIVLRARGYWSVLRLKVLLGDKRGVHYVVGEVEEERLLLRNSNKTPLTDFRLRV